MIDLFSIPASINPFLLAGIILLAGALGGWLAKRVRLPALTGYILGGVLIGPSCLGLIHGSTEHQALQPLSAFAMELIAISIGGHLSYHRIHNALGRITAISLLEVAGTMALVSLAARYFGMEWPLALLLGAISAETAPGTTLALIRENRGKGTFVKTLLSVVAVDNMLCVLLFAVVQILVSDYYRKGGVFPSPSFVLFRAAWQLVGAVGVALLIGKTASLLLVRAKLHGFSTFFVAVLFSSGLATYLGLSPLLTGLFLGVYLANSPSRVEEQLKALEPIEPLLYVCFFTLAGSSLHFDSLLGVGFLCVAYLVARFVGKGLGAVLGGLLSRCSRRIWINVPLSLFPHAGVAIGLVILLEGDPNIPEATTRAVSALILAAVTISEIVGPFLTMAALKRAKELNKDRARLMEFLEEQFILTGLKAFDKWDAIRQLVNFLVRTHRVDYMKAEDLYATVVEREKDMTTALGKGVAIPHGRTEGGPEIQGVLGIFRDGVPFDAPDGKPVQIIVLIATPKNHDDKHLQVLASLSAMISDEAIRTRLIAAISPNDAWEVIESEETRNYNYFIEGE